VLPGHRLSGSDAGTRIQAAYASPLAALAPSLLSPHVAYWPMLSKKDFGGAGPTTLIQDQEQTRNLDSRIYLLGFVRFNFSFHSSNAATFSTVSALLRHH